LLTGYNQRGDFPTAKIHLTALLEADPKNPQYRVLLARTNFQLNKPDDAFTELQTARKDDPTLDPPELMMGKLWAEKGDFTKADDWLNKASQAYPNVANVHRGYASYALDRGRLDVAKTHIAAAAKMEPNNRDTKVLQGLSARYAKDYAGAAAVFEEVVKEHPNFAFATANLAIVLCELADANPKRRAVELAELYVRQNPRMAEAYAVYGYTLLKNERVADAEKSLLQAASLGALSPDAAYMLARLFHQQSKFEDAHKVLKDALTAQGAFVYRADAQALFSELDKRVPVKKP
jgi:tetratricopeptide (TPR) repeat protein